MTSPNLDVFKDIVSVVEIEKQILNLLSEWVPTYTAEVCRQLSVDPAKLPAIRSYTRLNDFRHDPAAQTPGIVLINAGTSSRPVRNGEGWYRAPFTIALAVITSAATRDDSQDVAKLYAAAVRALMLQARAGGNMISDVSWLGESYDDIDVGQTDMLFAATGTFEVVADGLVKAVGAGPLAPSTDVPDDLPVVQSGKTFIS